ncbi:MAG: amidase [Betaproteobacteria bacterium]|nr:amidase [Betaproteobacteria bacterium]
MTDTGLLNLSLTEVASAIRRKKLSSVEVTRACLEHAARVQPKLNCFISLEADEALKAARKADQALKRGSKVGPLHGVPLAHKDMFYRAGKISTGGSKILREYRPKVTATVVERLAAAGAIWMGGLNMAEFAANPTGHNDHWGHCRNPWNPAHMTGGSSSGSGSAVAARACYGALGSDTGGSVRLPAAACGVVGLKPTSGLISRYGILPRSWSQDTVGPLTRTVRDCARVTRVIAGADPKDPTCVAEPAADYERALAGRIKGLRIGVPVNHYYDGATDDVRKRMDESLAVFRSLGARVAEIKVPDPQEIFLLSSTVSQSEAATMHGAWIRTRPQDYSFYVRSRMEAGFHIPATAYLQAINLRAHLLDEFMREVYGKVDFLHTPVMVMPPPTIAETEPKAAGDVAGIVSRITRNTRPTNYLGLPALSVPAGFSKSGLPIAFQLMGRPFSEALIFRAAHLYQQETDWHSRMPSL